MKIIGIGHQKGVGKSTLAKFLVTILRMKNPGAKIGQVSFADRVKDVSFDIFGWTGLRKGSYYESNYAEKEIKLPFGLSPREIWIGVGNKMREIDPTCWVEASLFQCDYEILIVPDVRFGKTEAQKLLDLGACLVKVHKDMDRGTDPAEVDMIDWSPWCKHVYNNGSLSELYAEAEKLSNYLEKN